MAAGLARPPASVDGRARGPTDSTPLSIQMEPTGRGRRLRLLRKAGHRERLLVALAHRPEPAVGRAGEVAQGSGRSRIDVPVVATATCGEGSIRLAAIADGDDTAAIGVDVVQDVPSAYVRQRRRPPALTVPV